MWIGFVLMFESTHRSKEAAAKHAVVNLRIALDFHRGIAVCTTCGVTILMVGQPWDEIEAFAAAEHIATGHQTTHTELVFNQLTVRAIEVDGDAAICTT